MNSPVRAVPSCWWRRRARVWMPVLSTRRRNGDGARWRSRSPGQLRTLPAGAGTRQLGAVPRAALAGLALSTPRECDPCRVGAGRGVGQDLVEAQGLADVAARPGCRAPALDARPRAGARGTSTVSGVGGHRGLLLPCVTPAPLLCRSRPTPAASCPCRRQSSSSSASFSLCAAATARWSSSRDVATCPGAGPARGSGGGRA